MENAPNGRKEQMPSTSQQPPPFPVVPLNGHMKIYENSRLEFNNPYTAKTVYFYKDNDERYAGIRIAISTSRYRSLGMLMDELNKQMFLPFGVRRIISAMTRDNITSVDELEHLGHYIASSSNPPKGLNLNRVHENFSATLRRNIQNNTNGNYMNTSPSLSSKAYARHLFGVNVVSLSKLTELVSAKLVRFTLNGKGKFYNAQINPMKKPTFDTVLEECSKQLEIAIHRLYTADGKIISSVDEILRYEGLNIICCPRHERPHVALNAQIASKLPEIHPQRYAARLINADTTNSNSPDSLDPFNSKSSSGNSIEKRDKPFSRERIPIVHTYIPRNRRTEQVAGPSNGFTMTNGNSTVTRSYSNPKPRTFVKATVIQPVKAEKPVKSVKQEIKRSKVPIRARQVKKEPVEDPRSSANTLDSGTGDSISLSVNSSQKSSRPESMTERKAQMIREELRMNLKASSTSEEYSENDMIKEEESDIERQAPPPIESGTSSETESESEEENEDSALGTSKQSPLPRGKSISHRTPAVQTPSSSGSVRDRNVITRQLMNREDSPYQQTPSRGSSSGSNAPKSNYSSRPQTGKIDEDSEFSEDSGESETETPAIHTPDTRLQTAQSRDNSAGSMRSFESESSKAWSRISTYSDKEVILPSDSESEDSEETPILSRKVQFDHFGHDYDDLGPATIQRLGRASDKIKGVLRKRIDDAKMNYTVEVLLGNRYGIDFDTQLYFVLMNEIGEQSEKFWSDKSEWLFSPAHEYDQQSWIVTNVRIRNMGSLRHIIVGHEMEGYGAGTYIDRIIVTEDLLEGRRFFFQGEKWIDSGQVDGLIERKIPVTSFLYQRKPDDKRRPTQGRWEFRLHTLQNDTGGTTSDLKISGFGNYDYHENLVTNDSLFRDPYSVPIIQLDFGIDIGDLRKVRFEVVGRGDKQDYWLEYVEAQDLDTRERCVMVVSEWLTANPEKRTQNFREVAVFSKDYFPSPTRTFEGTVKLSSKGMEVLEKMPKTPGQPRFYLQYESFSNGTHDIKNDTSGLFHVNESKTKTGKTIFTYKVDYVTIYPTPSIRVIPRLTDKGSEILSGMSILREIFEDMTDRSLIDVSVPIGEELFIEEIVEKPNEHVPYTQLYRGSTIDYEANNANGPYFKILHPIKATAAPTIRKWKKSEKEKEQVKVEENAEWLLHMSVEIIDRCKPIVPTVTLVAKDRRTYQMEALTEVVDQKPDGYLIVFSYVLSCPNFGNPCKLRLSCEEIEEDNITHIHKMILVEHQSNTHVFLKVDADLNEFETMELECQYPDVGSHDGVGEHELHIRTLEGGGDFRPYINIIGDKGDTGLRAYTGITKFAKNTVFEMFIAALSLGELRNIEVWAKTGNPKSWKGQIKIITSDEAIYESGVLSLSKNGQIALAPLNFIEYIEPVYSGETAI